MKRKSLKSLNLKPLFSYKKNVKSNGLYEDPTVGVTTAFTHLTITNNR